MSMDRAGSSSSSPSVSSAFSSACRTKIEPIRLSQDWTIENFSPLLKLCKPGHCLRSHIFRHASLTEATWQLCLYPAGKRSENQGFISLFLKMSSTAPNREILVTAEYKFHFVDDSGQVKFTNVNVGDFHAKPPKCGHSWGLRNIPRQRVVQALRSDGSLLVHCEIEFLPDPARLRSHVTKPTAVREKDVLSVARTWVDNMFSMYRDEILTDCKIVVQHNDAETMDAPFAANDDDDSTSRDQCKIFLAHKCVLSAHSDVFRAMFENESVIESEQNTIIITDFHADVVGSMLDYIYSGGTDNLSSIAADLLALSEKYSLLHLKSLCEDHLSGKICKDTVCQTCAVADLHRAEVLKQSCMNFFGANRRDVLTSEEWMELKERNPKLGNEILEHLLRLNTNDAEPPQKRSKFEPASSSIRTEARSSQNSLGNHLRGQNFNKFV